MNMASPLEEAERIREELPSVTDSSARAGLLNQLSRLLMPYDREAAVRHAIAARRLARKSGDLRQEAIATMWLGVARMLGADYQGALELLDRAGKLLAGAADDDPAVGLLAYNRGLLERDRGEYRRAVEEFMRSLYATRSGQDRALRVHTLVGLGNTYLRLSDNTRALDVLREASILSEDGPFDIERAPVLNGLGDVYQKLSEWDNALEHYLRCLEIVRRAHLENGEAVALMNIGTVHLMRHDFDAAFSSYTSALELFRKLGNRANQVILLSNIALCHTEFGRFAEAESALRESLDLAGEIGSRMGRAVALVGLGYAHKQMKRFDEALDYLRQGMEIASEIGDLRLQYEAANNESSIHEEAGRCGEAFDAYRQAVALKERIASRDTWRAVAAVEMRASIEKVEHEKEFYRLKNEQLEAESRHNAQKLEMQALHLLENKRFVEKLKEEIQHMASGFGEISVQLLMRHFDRGVFQESALQAFERQFDAVHHQFIQRLVKRCPALTPAELKVSAMLTMQLQNKEIATILNLSTRTVDTHRARIRKKLGLRADDNLASFLISL